jgi:hypothetical protein
MLYTVWIDFGAADLNTDAEANSLVNVYRLSDGLYELSAMAGYRRIGLVQSASRLPAVLWFVLLVGGAVTVASTCMFGASNGALHVIQVSAFALLISLVLVAIADINRRFRGLCTSATLLSGGRRWK